MNTETNKEKNLTREELYDIFHNTISLDSYEVKFLYKVEKVYGSARFMHLYDAEKFISILKEHGYKENEYELIESHGHRYYEGIGHAFYYPPHGIPLDGYSGDFDAYDAYNSNIVPNSYSFSSSINMNNPDPYYERFGITKSQAYSLWGRH